MKNMYILKLFSAIVMYGCVWVKVWQGYTCKEKSYEQICRYAA